MEKKKFYSENYYVKSVSCLIKDLNTDLDNMKSYNKESINDSEIALKSFTNFMNKFQILNKLVLECPKNRISEIITMIKEFCSNIEKVIQEYSSLRSILQEYVDCLNMPIKILKLENASKKKTQPFKLTDYM